MKTFKPASLSMLLLIMVASSWAVAKDKVMPTTKWVGSWAASQQLPEPRNMLSGDDVSDSTLRQVIRLSAGGKRIRIVFPMHLAMHPCALMQLMLHYPNLPHHHVLR